MSGIFANRHPGMGLAVLLNKNSDAVAVSALDLEMADLGVLVIVGRRARGVALAVCTQPKKRRKKKGEENGEKIRTLAQSCRDVAGSRWQCATMRGHLWDG